MQGFIFGILLPYLTRPFINNKITDYKTYNKNLKPFLRNSIIKRDKSLLPLIILIINVRRNGINTLMSRRSYFSKNISKTGIILRNSLKSYYAL